MDKDSRLKLRRVQETPRDRLQIRSNRVVAVINFLYYYVDLISKAVRIILNIVKFFLASWFISNQKLRIMYETMQIVFTFVSLQRNHEELIISSPNHLKLFKILKIENS